MKFAAVLAVVLALLGAVVWGLIALVGQLVAPASETAAAPAATGSAPAGTGSAPAGMVGGAALPPGQATPAGFRNAAHLTFLADWLRARGETELEFYDEAVRLQGVPVYLTASDFHSGRGDEGEMSVDVEFCVSFNGERYLVDYYIGYGATEEEARAQALENIAELFLDAIHTAFLDRAAPAAAKAGGPIGLVAGPTVVRFFDAPEDLKGIEARLEEFAQQQAAQPPSQTRPQWVRVVYTRSAGEDGVPDVLLNNQPSDELNAALAALPWPEAQEAYFAARFFVLR